MRFQERITIDDPTVVNDQADLLQIADVGRGIGVDHENIRVVSRFDLPNIAPPKHLGRIARRRSDRLPRGEADVGEHAELVVK